MSGPNDTPAARAIDAHDDMTSVIKNFTVANIRLEIRTIYHSAWCMCLSSLKAHFATEVCFEHQIEDTSCRISGYFHTTPITFTQGQLLGWSNLSNCWQMRPQYSCFTPQCGNHKPVENWPLSLDTFLSTFWRGPTNVQNVALYWQWSIYFWIVPKSGTSGLNTSLLLLWKTFLKVSTIKTSLVLLKMPIFSSTCHIVWCIKSRF